MKKLLLKNSETCLGAQENKSISDQCINNLLNREVVFFVMNC